MFLNNIQQRISAYMNPFVQRAHTLWLDRVEGPYLKIHTRSQGFRRLVQALACLALAASATLGLFGLLVGLGGFAGIVLSAIGDEQAPSLWVALAIMSVGVLITTIAGCIGYRAFTFMNVTVKHTILGSVLTLMGSYLAYCGLGILGLMGPLGLDPFGLFAYAAPDPMDSLMMVLLAIAGTLVAIVGLATLPWPTSKTVAPR